MNSVSTIGLQEWRTGPWMEVIQVNFFLCLVLSGFLMLIYNKCKNKKEHKFSVQSRSVSLLIIFVNFTDFFWWPVHINGV